ncbi:MAG TPA: hypothetical protein GXX46_05200 [Peptococcaceae bacterium]|nr:hypothetical protein [Peptococcaceae bacterium]
MASSTVYLIGWPGIIASLLLLFIGLSRKRPGYIILGAILAVPISWYLGSTPLFRTVLYFLPFLLAGSALAMRYQKIIMAWLLVIPYVVLIVWLAASVLSQGWM